MGRAVGWGYKQRKDKDEGVLLAVLADTSPEARDEYLHLLRTSLRWFVKHGFTCAANGIVEDLARACQFEGQLHKYLGYPEPTADRRQLIHDVLADWDPDGTVVSEIMSADPVGYNESFRMDLFAESHDSNEGDPLALARDLP